MLFGPSGIRKRQAANALALVCEKLLPGCKAQVLDVGDHLGKSAHLVLGDPPRAQQEEVAEAVERMLKQREKANLFIVNLHASHLCCGIPVFPLSAETFRTVKPDICLTLFDDVYACKARLDKEGYPFRYESLLNWRIVECAIGDFLAAACDVENLYVAAKHPAITAFRLIFEPRRARIYSASQITAVRDDPKLRDGIEKHRRILHRQYAVLDPLTIDDRVLVNGLPGSGGSKYLMVPPDARWPADLSDLGENYVSLVPEDPSVFPVKVNKQEAVSLSKPIEQNSFRSLIDTQIRSRDFRYIDQADVVAAYRPRLNGHESSGVAAEKTYAAGSAATLVVEYSPPPDTRDLGSKPFSTSLFGPVCKDLPGFYKKLDQEAKREAGRRYTDRQAYYARFEAFRSTFA